MSETIVIVTGGFDPLHSGHIVYFEDAKKLGDKLIVGVNSDEWLVNKKGRFFMPLSERIEIIKNLTIVDEIVTFDDQDNSASGAIRTVLENFPNNKILFANGGDRTSGNTLEMDAFKDQTNVEFVFGVGGDFKKNSSSWILEEWKSPTEERPWGSFKILDEKKEYKIKELTVNPGARLSLQSHSKREETWVVLEGEATVTINEMTFTKIKNETIHIPQGAKHRLENKYDSILKIIEIQTGIYFGEDDITRYDDDFGRI
ncbi:MAG: adenylyltransferase/cytidyltransferase family protein [Pelagibacterales bacterium]|nr:adenylyltransferase/cytidyltransferase family protein [Pelagibacterales bacterium]